MGNMTKMVIKKIYIFSPIEKRAKVVEFSDGKNIITCSPVDGTDRGKSVIMKSIYHSLGADCNFDAKWDDASKTYITHFSIGNKEYIIYRCNRLFKIFDAKHNLLFKTISRTSLAEFLTNNIYGFGVKLPDREEEKLELTPPVYNYLLYFLDQDKLDGPNFSSFKSLGHYPNYKENVLYYHFGVFDDEYYNIIRNLELLTEKQKKLEKQELLANEMMGKINFDINAVSYSNDLELLKNDIESSKEKYSLIAQSLSKIKQKLTLLRNDKDELLRSLESLKLLDHTIERQISILNKHNCPLCKSRIEDTLDLKISRYNTSDDIIFLSNDLQISISKIDVKITEQENVYKDWLAKLNEYKKNLSTKASDITNVLKHQGYIELKDSLISELRDIELEKKKNNEQQKEYEKVKKQYSFEKKKINEYYYELMLKDKLEFRLEEIDESSFNNIKKVFSAGGSNKPISTVIWYINLIKIKNKFNSDVINFPIVFDSPNNAESDLEKKVEVYRYLVDNVDEQNQLIVSGVGYEKETFDGVEFDKVIFLHNEKYRLLTEVDYNENLEFLKVLASKH